MSEALVHLTASSVRAIHEQVLAAHGGAAGVREAALLESAVAAPAGEDDGTTTPLRSGRNRRGLPLLPLSQPSLGRWQQAHRARRLSRLLETNHLLPEPETSSRPVGKPRYQHHSEPTRSRPDDEALEALAETTSSQEKVIAFRPPPADQRSVFSFPFSAFRPPPSDLSSPQAGGSSGRERSLYAPSNSEPRGPEVFYPR